MADDAKLEDFPVVHAAYSTYLETTGFDPGSAQQLVQWCKRQGIKDVKYANVNKYLRIRRKTHTITKAPVKKAAVKSSLESSFVRSAGPSVGLVSSYSQRFLVAVDESKKDRTSGDFAFDKGKTKADGFGNITNMFEEVMEKETHVAKQDYSAWKKERVASFSEYSSDTEAKETLDIDPDLLNELESSTAGMMIEDSPDLETDDDFDDSKTTEDTSSAAVTTAAAAVASKPWLRSKPAWKPGDPNMASSEETEELRGFLAGLKMEQFLEPLQDAGVHTLGDLKLLEDESEINELVGPDGLALGPVFRRKFTKAVMKLDRTASASVEAPAVSVEVGATAAVPSADAVVSPAVSPSPGPGKGVSSLEQKALNKLVSSIKTHTLELRVAREELTSVQGQVATTKKQIEEIYNKALGIMSVRRKQLEKALDMAEQETSSKLKTKVADLQGSAKKLLICKKSVETKMATQPGTEERTQSVVGEVKAALAAVPEQEPGKIRIIFDTGNDDLLEVLENFGTIGVGRTTES